MKFVQHQLGVCSLPACRSEACQELRLSAENVPESLHNFRYDQIAGQRRGFVEITASS